MPSVGSARRHLETNLARPVGRPSSWQELVAALVALRAEVAALRRVPERASAVSAGELLDD